MPEFTTDDGARINYVVEGEGEPTLVFVHGWCSNLRHWDPQADHFATRHRVLRLDRRGYGRSPMPASYHFDVEREAADIAQLMASLSITDAVVVGHAGGVPTAITFAAGYPELVGALVCEEGAALPADPSLEAMLTGMIDQLSGPNYDDVMKAIYPGFFHPGADKDLVAACAADAAQTPQEVAVGYLAAMPTMDMEQRARSLRVPVLFAWAEQPLMPVTLEQLQESVPRARLVEIPGTAHFAHLDAPDRFNEQLDMFIEDVGTSHATR
jgi:pimeloyl-ACP methyl ester carboxylesterase